MRRKPKQNKTYLTITIDPTLVELIDKRRGLIPRSTFIADILEKYIEGRLVDEGPLNIEEELRTQEELH